MKKIELTNSGVAICDDEDYAFVSNFKWCRLDCKSGLTYAMKTATDEPRELHRYIVGAHRATFNGKPIHIHHRDGNGLNCCKRNMRIGLPGQHQAAHLTKKDPR